MKVAWTMSMDSELPVLAFAADGTVNKNAFVIVNTSFDKEKPVEVTLKGTSYGKKYRIFRTNGKNEKYSDLGEMNPFDGKFVYKAPPNSVTTFFEE